jgi:copper oxidase (laccase) domain-containing protein
LVHSGKKGTELGIAPKAIGLMREKFGSDPGDIIVQLSPCIRPPAYEIDFAAIIREDCANAGVPIEQIHDPGTCTSQDLDAYYSYRTEQGQTGRHLAVIGWQEWPT